MIHSTHLSLDFVEEFFCSLTFVGQSGVWWFLGHHSSHCGGGFCVVFRDGCGSGGFCSSGDLPCIVGYRGDGVLLLR